MKKEAVAILKVYLFTWCLVIALFISRVFWADISLLEAFNELSQFLGSWQFHVSILILFGILYILFLAIRYSVRTRKKQGYIVMLKRLSFRIIAPALSLFLVFKLLAFTTTNEGYEYEWDYSIENKSKISKNLYQKDGKHRGMTVFGWRQEKKGAVTALIKSNIEWVAIVPFFYQKDETTLQIQGRDNMDIWSRRDSTFINSMNRLQEKGVHVMLKPHLWMSDGWRSNLSFNSEAAWDNWFASYRIYMLHYAKMAEETGAEVLCIGTELKTSIHQQPEKWSALISEIRGIYSGQLTYAANWDDDLDGIAFWEQLDFIGVQAYFPLTETKNPDLESIQRGWEPYISMLESLSEKHNKPILFTEIGYRSDASSTIKPWEWNTMSNILFSKKSDKTQQLAYEALFEQLWHKEWFAGIYFWQWNTQMSKESAATSLDFSPRFKPAENIMAKWYGREDDWVPYLFNLFQDGL